MLSYCLVFLSLTILVLIIGVILGKSIFIKLLFFSAATNIAVLFICFMGSFAFNDTYIDIGIIYLLLSFIAMLAYLKYFVEFDKQS